MGKDKTRVPPNSDEPTFDKQIDVYSEGEQDPNDPIFSRAYHQFMVNLLTKRDKSVKDELINEMSVIMADYNKDVEKTISTLLGNQTKTVGNVVGEVMVAIESIDKKLKKIETANSNEHKDIMTALSDLKTRQDLADEKIRKEELELKLLKQAVEDHTRRFEYKKKRIDGLEKNMVKIEKDVLAKIRQIDDEIHGEAPVVFGSYRLNKLILVTAVAVLLSTVITFTALYFHAKKVRIEHRQQIELEMKK